jgi:hypothetical protein
VEDGLQPFLPLAECRSLAAQILQKLQQRADGEEKLDWSLHYVDSTVVRAHHHAAGAKGGREARRWVEVVAGSVQRSMCVPRDTESRSSSYSRVVNATSRLSLSR